MPGAPAVKAASPPKSILQLVERFTQHRETYKHPAYNETQVRREFIDPLFKALGWDVDNRAGHAEAYKDVIHEDAIKVGGSTKAPDYCFRIGGVRKFFLEAKKPAVPLKKHAESAYQLRRYAWSAKLPLSILTDFEEMAVYDCRVRPHKDDKAATARTLYFTYDEYVARWGELAAVFLKDAVLKGSFDKYAESSRRKRGTAEVDGEFLKEIESWRDALARNFALRNADLSARDLNFAVQRTVDRLLFLRLCEDRGIEPYGQLRALRNGDAIYPRLGELFRKADDKYNSSLFYFRAEPGRESPDALTLNLDLDNKVLKDILGRLYYPDCPYEFAVLPPEILGQVYEQFLGKVIRLTRGHRAVVEDKPEVKKAGGVYYTPAYIVDYIVKHTVGKLLEGKKPKDVGPDRETKTGKARKLPKRAKILRVLDPACGSGSFLLGAYEHLLAWHRDWYIGDGPKKHTDRIYQGPGGQWRLTIREKKRILLNNIYGVDIDAQAVEVTKLSLLLKVLEHESAETIGSTLRLFHERALPDLNENIKCGNSLIGPDFYDNQQMSMFDEEERYRINVFDWHAEFPEVFEQSSQRKQRVDQSPERKRRVASHSPSELSASSAPSEPGGPPPRSSPESRKDHRGRGRPGSLGTDPNAGFDAVIGNPPYVLLQGEFRDDRQLDYFRSKYAAASYKIDTYHLFIERGVKLARVGGRCALITPANFLTNNYLANLRRFLLHQSAIEHIVVIDGGVFQGISVDNAVFVLSAGEESDGFPVLHATEKGRALIESSRITVERERSLGDRHTLFTGSAEPRLREIWDKIGAKAVLLGKLAHVNFGKQLRNRKKFLGDVIEVTSTRQVAKQYRPCYTGRDIERYKVTWNGLACLNDQVARCGGCWDDRMQNSKGKLLTRQIGKFPEYALDELGFQCLNTMFMINVREEKLDRRYLLGILNSTLLAAMWLDRFYDQRRTFPKIKGTYLKQLPIRLMSDTKSGEKEECERLIALVQQMLDLHKQLAAAKTPTDKTAIQRQIDATDGQIDRLVYELYELTDTEIAIVEEATA